MNKKIIFYAVGVILIIGGFFLLRPKQPTQPLQLDQSGQKTQQPVKSVAQEQNQTQNYDITISNFAFNPNTITINKGDTVVWTNTDPVPHQVVGDSFTALNGNVISKGQTYSFTFNEIGTFNYHCSIHPMMKAVIIVK